MHDVYIRPLEIKDALTSYKWRNNPKIWEYTGKQPDKIITPEIELNWIKKVLEEKDSKRFAIIADDIYIGNIQLTNIKNGTGEYHIFIGNTDFWGKGAAFKASLELFKFARLNNISKIYLYVNIYHKRAINLYTKLGFKKVTVVNNAFKMIKNL